MSPKLRDFTLVAVISHLQDPEEILDSIDQTLDSMKLDYTTFEVGITPQQEQYMIKNIHNTVERLKDIRKMLTFYKGDWHQTLVKEYEEVCSNQRPSKCSIDQTYQKYKEAFGKYYQEKKIQHEVDSVIKIMYFGEYDLI